MSHSQSSPFTTEQIAELDKPLPKPLISTRKGSNKMLSYLEGHDAVDQGNRLFGFGNWSYRTLSCEQTVLLDPVTGEPVGIAYKAKVELTVVGCHGSIVEVGSQPVAAWNVRDVVMSRRKQGEDGPVQEWEKVNAQRTIVEAHEHAEKGAVTDAMKRALRTFGSQFGNGLYGDGTADISTADTSTNAPQRPTAHQANGTSHHSKKSTQATSASSQSDLTAMKAEVKQLGIAANLAEWQDWKRSVLEAEVPDKELTAEHLATLRALIDEFKAA